MTGVPTLGSSNSPTTKVDLTSLGQPIRISQENDSQSRITMWLVGLAILTTLVSLGVGIYASYNSDQEIENTTRSIDLNAPPIAQTAVGSIDKPLSGVSTLYGDASVIRSNTICAITGKVQYLAPGRQLWLMELRYYSASTPRGAYDPTRVHYSPSDYPMHVISSKALPKTGYSGPWSNVYQKDGGCQNPLYVGTPSPTLINRFAIFLVSMTANDSGKVRQYNVAKAKDKYPGIALPASSQILDVVDVVQCPATLTSTQCKAATPR